MVFGASSSVVVKLECQCGSRVVPVLVEMGFNDNKKLRRLRRSRLFGRAKVYFTVRWPQLVRWHNYTWYDICTITFVSLPFRLSRRARARPVSARESDIIAITRNPPETFESQVPITRLEYSNNCQLSAMLAWLLLNNATTLVSRNGGRKWKWCFRSTTFIQLEKRKRKCLLHAASCKNCDNSSLVSWEMIFMKKFSANLSHQGTRTFTETHCSRQPAQVLN